MNIYGGRRPELDALRGIAALCVMVGHSFAVGMHPDNQLLVQPFDLARYINFFIHLIFDENGAVVVFFVLSGLVLAMQIDGLSGRPHNQMAEYYIRRITRIIPAMWVAVAGIFAIKTWLSMSDGGHYDIFIKTLAFRDSRLDGPLWTIYVEMGCSLVFPALYWLRKRGAIINLIVFAILYVQMSNGAIPNWCRFIVFFHLGLWIDPLGRAVMEKLGPKLSLAVASIGVVALCVTAALCSVLNLSILIWLRIDGLAAFLLIAYIYTFRGGVLASALFSGGAQYLGRISYCTYLIHFVVIEWLWQKVIYLPAPGSFEILGGQFVALFVVLSVTLPLATLLHYLVERPGISWGRRVAANLNRKISPDFNASHA